MAGTARVIAQRHRGDMRWMEVRGRTYYAVQAVPRPLWGRVGKRRLVKSLGTRDHYVAIGRRYAVLAEFQRIFDRMRGADDIVKEALDWRETISALERGNTSRFEVSMSGEQVRDP